MILPGDWISSHWVNNCKSEHSLLRDLLGTAAISIYEELLCSTVHVILKGASYLTTEALACCWSGERRRTGMLCSDGSDPWRRYAQAQGKHRLFQAKTKTIHNKTWAFYLRIMCTTRYLITRNQWSGDWWSRFIWYGLNIFCVAHQ